MKATIEIPDELYRQVKAKSALEARTIREVTVELYQAWLAQDASRQPLVSPEQWVNEWIRLGREALHDASSTPTAREIMEQDRNRLEQR